MTCPTHGEDCVGPLHEGHLQELAIHAARAWGLRPIALVVGPWRDRTEEDAARMDGILERLLQRGWAPIFYPYALSRLVDDDREPDRTVGLLASKSLVHYLAWNAHTFPVALFVDRGCTASEGMLVDLEEWEWAGILALDAPDGSKGWADRLDAERAEVRARSAEFGPPEELT